jgi:hypothetical protein
MIIKYNSSVKTNAGWRGVTITAQAEKISEKRLIVQKVVDIDGNGSSGYASRTGAKRQEYSLGYFAKQQIGAVKLTSKVEVLA